MFCFVCEWSMPLMYTVISVLNYVGVSKLGGGWLHILWRNECANYFICYSGSFETSVTLREDDHIISESALYQAFWDTC